MFPKTSTKVKKKSKVLFRIFTVPQQNRSYFQTQSTDYRHIYDVVKENSRCTENILQRLFTLRAIMFRTYTESSSLLFSVAYTLYSSMYNCIYLRRVGENDAKSKSNNLSSTNQMCFCVSVAAAAVLLYVPFSAFFYTTKSV